MSTTDYDIFIKQWASTRLSKFQKEFVNKIKEKFNNPKHGKFKEWQNIIASLPEITPSKIDLKLDAPMVGISDDCSDEVKEILKNKLKALNPWRKGPFNIFGIHVNAEWRSDWKWSRIAPHIKDLNEKLVLDIGSSNGYYALRMQAMGAKLVLGVEPTWLYVFQYLALQKYLLKADSVSVVPFSLEELPEDLMGFDTIFSMGVLYHRQDPQAHLERVYKLLQDNGQLVLETLIIEDEQADLLIPKDRYANMRNVWMIPSYPLIEKWFEEANFKNIQLVDVTKTTIEEQRQTQWMTGYSLANALHPKNPNLTVEGYPAPTRAVVLAEKI